MRIDPRLADVLEVDATVEDLELARVLAEVAGARAPNGEREVELWIEYASALDEQLVNPGVDLMDGAEASHGVASSMMNRTRESAALWYEMLQIDLHRDPADEPISPFDALGGIASRNFVRQLAAAGCFRLL